MAWLGHFFRFLNGGLEEEGRCASAGIRMASVDASVVPPYNGDVVAPDQQAHCACHFGTIATPRLLLSESSVSRTSIIYEVGLAGVSRRPVKKEGCREQVSAIRTDARQMDWTGPPPVLKFQCLGVDESLVGTI